MHGLAQWNYNSDGLNANDFFNNQAGVPRSKAVSNQYAAQIGGPIKRDKLFFFVDTEGIRYVQPSTGFVESAICRDAGQYCSQSQHFRRQQSVVRWDVCGNERLRRLTRARFQ